jgi:hypothetical protein
LIEPGAIESSPSIQSAGSLLELWQLRLMIPHHSLMSLVAIQFAARMSAVITAAGDRVKA